LAAEMAVWHGFSCLAGFMRFCHVWRGLPIYRPNGHFSSRIGQMSRVCPGSARICPGSA